ncbi:putative diguanylate cyclase YegE [mine drainage metagenome]|uniref:Putative diguanylate cyclase YegE n=1 Tax=mine drainage metagenome TaxID=410659 RepID=A0A1J5SB55_9ZZZZ
MLPTEDVAQYKQQDPAYMEPQIGSSNSPRFAPGPILVFAGFILATLLSGDMLFVYMRDGVRLEAQRSITEVGTLKANQIDNWLDDHFTDAGMLSGNSDLLHEVQSWIRGGTRDDARRRQIANRFGEFLNLLHYEAVVLYDASGSVLLNTGEPVPDAQERGKEARAAAASCQHKFIDLHPYQDGNRSIRLGFMSPLSAGETCFGAIYLVEDPARYLFPLIHYWPNENKTAETQLVRKDGDQVLFLDQLRYRTEPPMAFKLPLDTQQASAIALRGKQGLLENARNYRGKSVLAYATAISGTPWMLVSKVDEDEAYRLVNRMERMAGAMVLLVFCLIGAWFWQWRRRVLAEARTAILNQRIIADGLRLEGEKRFRTIFELTSLPLVRNSLTGEFIEVNEAWCKLFGYSQEEVLSRHLSWQQLTHPDDFEPSDSMLKKMIAGEMPDYKIEKRYLHKDGSVLWGIAQVKLVRDEKGEPAFTIGTIQDITERKQAEKMISFMAYHDRLTGLPNRALLFDRLSQAMSQAKRDGKSVALLFADLDGFKAVNDKYGHEAGDSVLKMAAQRFLACVREVDTVARFGGDEFAVILGNLDDPQQARGVAEKVVQAFAQGLVLADGSECNVGASVGISIYPENGSAMDNLMTAADQAMYESKRIGKNTYTFYNAKASPRNDSIWFKIDDSHLVGVEEIDEQHGNLVYMVNRLNDALKRDDSPETILLMFDELQVATQHHFDTESRYMANCHYPGREAHEAEHAQLLNQLQHFKAQFNEGRELLVLQSIKDWLLEHITYSDKKMAAYLAQHGVT